MLEFDFNPGSHQSGLLFQFEIIAYKPGMLIPSHQSPSLKEILRVEAHLLNHLLHVCIKSLEEERYCTETHYLPPNQWTKVELEW